jgi:hypothetical protein
MTRHPFVLILLIALTLVLVACGSTDPSSPSSGAASFSCTFKQFSATVYQGPDRGLSVQGQLTLQVNQTGSLSGTLKQTSGPDVSVVGQADGRAINLVFNLGQNRLLFGVGTLQQDIHSCAGAAGGPLVGPNGPDSGNWGTPSKPGGSGGGN